MAGVSLFKKRLKIPDNSHRPQTSSVMFSGDWAIDSMGWLLHVAAPAPCGAATTLEKGFWTNMDKHGQTWTKWPLLKNSLIIDINS